MTHVVRDATAPSLLRSTLRSSGLIGPATLVAGLVLAAALGPLLWHASASATDLTQGLTAPGLAHPMGTDSSGRDVLARFLAGARISILAGVSVAAGSAAIGIPLGAIAGLRRGWIDRLIIALADIVLAFPQIILAMAVAIGFGAGVVSACMGAALGCVPVWIRLVRAEVRVLDERRFVHAARVSGLPEIAVFGRHIFPHLAPTLLVQAAAVFGSAVVTLAALSFIGLGAQIPTPEWGAMIADGVTSSLTGAWWVVGFPGAGLFILVVAANLLADRAQAVVIP
ncbi:MAG: ABC transporter permease [Gordonia sp. (in: high G+C Gram-positive bacteria)]